MVDVTPRRRPRRWLRWLLGLALLALVTPVAAGALAQTGFARAYVGRKAAEALREQLGLIAHIDEIRLDPSRLSIVASGITLDHPKHGRFVKASTLEIRPSWWALLRGSVDLHRITIDHAVVWLKVRDGRIENLPSLAAPKTAASDKLDLPFHTLSLSQAKLVVDADPIASGELRGIEITVSTSSPTLLNVRLEAFGGFVRHAVGRDVLTHLKLLGTYSLHGLNVDVLRFETPELQIAVREGELALPRFDYYRGRVELGLFLPQLARWPHGFTLPDLQGEVHVEAKLQGDAHGPRGTAAVELDRVVVKQFGIGERVNLDTTFDPTQVAFRGVSRLIRNGGSVDLDGRLSLAEHLPLEIRANVHDVSFAKLMEELGVSPNAIVDWTIAGTFTLAGTADPLALSGPLRMPTRDFKVLRHAWHAPPPERRIIAVSSAKLAGTVAVRPDGIHLQDIDIELPRSRLNATVLLGFDNALRVEAQGLEWNLEDCSPLIDLPLGGRGGFKMEVSGTFSDPAVRGHVKLSDYAFAGFDFGDVETDFEVDRDLMGVHFPHLDATKGQSRYAIEGGFLDFRKDAFRTGGQLGIERLALADFYRIFHYDGDDRYEPYQGVVNGKVGLDYTMGYPGDSANGTLRTTLELAIPEATLDGYAFRDGRFVGGFKWLDHAVGYKALELSVDRLWLRKGAGTLSVSGHMRQGGVLDFVTVGDKLSVRDTEGLRERAPSLTGALAVTGSIKGTASAPRADLDLVATGLALGGEPIGDGRAYVRLTDKSDPWITEALGWKAGAPPAGAPCGHGREGLARGSWPEDPPLHTREGPQPHLDQPMAFVICGQALDGQLSVDLAVGRTEAYPLRGRFDWNGLSFGRLLPRARANKPMHGTVSGTLQLDDGALQKPESLSGALRLTELRAGELDVELKNKGPLDLRFDHGSFEVVSARLIGPSSELDITGGGSLKSGLALNFDGSVDLGLLSTLSRTVTEASGTLAASFRVSGPIAQPAVYGEATLRDGALKIASFPEAVREVSGKVTFSARRVLLEGFSAKVAGGKVAWSGAAELAGHGIGSYALDIEAGGLAFSPKDGIDLKLGGEGRLSWKQGDRLPLLGGKLRLDELTYKRPIKMERTLGDMAGPERAQSETYDPALDMLAIDIEVEQAKPLRMNNNLIDAELRLETDKIPFRLVGTDQRMGVVGSMAVSKGKIRFRERTFDIRQGDVRFDDETRIDPRFDLRATTEVRRTTDRSDWRIEIHAFGSRDHFQFELSSEPYLSEDDIALLLTVGMTHAELAQLQTSELASTAALEALATVTGVGGEVHRALPQIDDFHISSAYSERTNRTEPQVVIGKRIAENVRLSASTGIAESRDFKTGVELELNDKTSVQAVYNNQNTTSASQIGDVGVDLKWRLEFD
ncbi:MAG: translocation/assembly module TamB domain-containing protein [Polyangiales bacterium]